MTTDHRWNTDTYEKRTRELYRTELHKLYPSEAWALYRILPQCQDVLDLGCGNGAMAAISRQIAPHAHYTGVDHQARLMNEAKEAFPYASFVASDLGGFLPQSDVFDCVMSWSVVKSFGNWRELIKQMLAHARRFVIFDLRVANTPQEAFDESVCYADYGGRRGPIVLCNYPALRDALLDIGRDCERIEIAGYQSEWGPYVHFQNIRPDTFLVTCVLHKGTDASTAERAGPELFERLPGNLDR